MSNRTQRFRRVGVKVSSAETRAKIPDRSAAVLSRGVCGRRECDVLSERRVPSSERDVRRHLQIAQRFSIALLGQAVEASEAVVRQLEIGSKLLVGVDLAWDASLGVHSVDGCLPEARIGTRPRRAARGPGADLARKYLSHAERRCDSRLANGAASTSTPHDRGAQSPGSTTLRARPSRAQ